MKKKVTELKKVYDGKFIKTYVAKYETEKGVKNYEIASRKEHPDVLSKNPQPDAVRILPYYYENNGELKIVLIREFRYAINDYIYGLPAGLIDEGESPETSAKRELEEEIGAEVVNIKQTEKASYSSAGFCDESIICYEAEVNLKGLQHLDCFEDITVKSVSLDVLKKMLEEEEFGLQSRLQLRGFLYKQMLATVKGKVKRVGAFVGKFLPPHIGHLSVIDKALKECDEVVVVLSDNPEKSKELCAEAKFPYFSSKKRLNWIKKHYRARKNMKFYILDESKMEEYNSQNYAELFWSEVKEKVNVKYGEELYRKLNEESFSQCEFVAIDRNKVKISGTAIRKNDENIKYMIEEGKAEVLKAIKKNSNKNIKNQKNEKEM